MYKQLGSVYLRQAVRCMFAPLLIASFPQTSQGAPKLAKALIEDIDRRPVNVIPSGVDADRDGLDDGVEAALINIYSPYIMFDASESYWPADADWFVEHSNLYHIDRQYPTYDRTRRVCTSEPRSEVVIPRSSDSDPLHALSTNPLYLLEYSYLRPTIPEPCPHVPFSESTNILCLDAKTE